MLEHSLIHDENNLLANPAPPEPFWAKIDKAYFLVGEKFWIYAWHRVKLFLDEEGAVEWRDDESLCSGDEYYVYSTNQLAVLNPAIESSWLGVENRENTIQVGTVVLLHHGPNIIMEDSEGAFVATWSWLFTYQDSLVHFELKEDMEYDSGTLSWSAEAYVLDTLGFRVKRENVEVVITVQYDLMSVNAFGPLLEGDPGWVSGLTYPLGCKGWATAAYFPLYSQVDEKIKYRVVTIEQSFTSWGKVINDVLPDATEVSVYRCKNSLGDDPDEEHIVLVKLPARTGCKVKLSADDVVSYIFSRESQELVCISDYSAFEGSTDDKQIIIVGIRLNTTSNNIEIQTRTLMGANDTDWNSVKWLEPIPDPLDDATWTVAIEGTDCGGGPIPEPVGSRSFQFTAFQQDPNGINPCFQPF